MRDLHAETFLLRRFAIEDDLDRLPWQYFFLVGKDIAEELIRQLTSLGEIRWFVLVRQFVFSCKGLVCATKGDVHGPGSHREFSCVVVPVGLRPLTQIVGRPEFRNMFSAFRSACPLSRR
jgi:hypothetical protein